MASFKAFRLVGLISAVALADTAQAARVYIHSSQYQPQDDAVVAALTGLGHSTTVGVPFHMFDGT
jgi:hypothetical protein